MIRWALVIPHYINWTEWPVLKEQFRNDLPQLYFPHDTSAASEKPLPFLRDSITSSFQSYAKKCKYIIICDKVFLQSKKFNSLVAVGGLFSGATVSAVLFSCKRFDPSSDTWYPAMSSATRFSEWSLLGIILTYSFSEPFSIWHNRADILYKFTIFSSFSSRNYI